MWRYEWMCELDQEIARQLMDPFANGRSGNSSA